MSRSLYSILNSRFGEPLSASERLSRIEEKARAERPRWQPVEVPVACASRPRETRVAVVGAGFAGLLAARNLSRKGVKVQVYEAYKELGGRVRSNRTFSNGRITEEGAELIGSIHPNWRDLAIDYNLAYISRMDGDLYAREGLGAKIRLDKLLSTREQKELHDGMNRFFKGLALDAHMIADPSRPWLQKTLQMFDKMSVADKLHKSTKQGSLLWKGMDLLLRNNNVAPLDELNYLGLLCLVKGGQFGNKDRFLMGYWTELEIFRCSEGCQQLALEMAREIQAPEQPGNERRRGEIFLNKLVTAIDLGKQQVSLSWVDVRNGKPATGGQGQTEQFDFIVLAIPPTVWKSVQIKPRHPSDKDQIGELGTGAAVKFFTDVKERFWIREKAAPYGGSSRIGQVWEASDNQTRIPGQGIVLSVFTGSRAPSEKEYVDGLKELYPTYERNLQKTLRRDWSDAIDYNSRFVQTGYASPKKGQIFRVGAKLTEAFQDRLFFAGEHTQADFFGYMEGALRSGARAAKAVLDQMCRLPAPPLKVQVAGAPQSRAHTQSLAEQSAYEFANEFDGDEFEHEDDEQFSWDNRVADQFETEAARFSEEEPGPMEFHLPAGSASPTLGFEFDLNYGFERKVVDAKGLTPPVGFDWPREALKATDHAGRSGAALKDGFVVTMDAVRLEIATVPFAIGNDKEFNDVLDSVKKFGQELIDAKKTYEAALIVPGVAGHPTTFEHPRTVVNKPELDAHGNIAFLADRDHAAYKLASVPLVIHRLEKRYPRATDLWASPQATLTLPLSQFGKLVWLVHETNKGGAPGEAFTGRVGDRLGLRDDLAWIALKRAVAERKKKIGTTLSDGTRATEADFTCVTPLLAILLMYMLTSVIVDPQDAEKEGFCKGSLPLNIKTPFWQIHKFALSDREKRVLHDLYTDSGKRRHLFELASGKTREQGRNKLFPAHTHGDISRFHDTLPNWDMLVNALAKEEPVIVTRDNRVEKKGHLKGNEILIAPLSSKIDWDKTKPNIAVEMRRLGFGPVGFAKWPRLMKNIRELARKVNP